MSFGGKNFGHLPNGYSPSTLLLRETGREEERLNCCGVCLRGTIFRPINYPAVFHCAFIHHRLGLLTRARDNNLCTNGAEAECEDLLRIPCSPLPIMEIRI